MSRHRWLVPFVLIGLAGLVSAIRVDARDPGSSWVAGRVVDADGDAIRGARVGLVSSAEPLFADFNAARFDDGVAEPAGEVSSDEDGFFRQSVPTTGSWRLQVETDGHEAATVDLADLVADRELPTLVLPRARRSTVRVIDTEGRPRAEARILARPTASLDSLEPPWGPAPRDARVDAQGRAQLNTAGPLDVAVVAEGFAVARRRVEPGEEVQIRLEAGAMRTLRVVDAEGRPRAGARVAVDGVAWPATSDVSGRLDLAVAADRPSEVRLLDDEARWAVARIDPAEPMDEEPSAIEVRLREPTIVRGQVIDRGSRQPLVGARVWATADPLGVVTSDRRGAFVLAVPFGAPARLAAARAGHLPSQAATGEHTTLALEPAATIRGRVVDERGRSVGGVEIRLDPNVGERAGTGLGSSRWAWSDADGAFLLLDVDPDPTYRLLASRTGHAETRVPVAGLDTARPGPALRIVLPRGLDATGRVVDEADRPVAGAVVQLLPSSLATDEDGVVAAVERARRATTDSAGRFVFHDLPPGPVDLHASAAGRAPVRVRGVPLEPVGPARSEVDLGTLVLEDGAAVAGWVVDADGRSLEGATITVEEAAAEARWRLGFVEGESTLRETLRQATTDADGAFRLGGLAPGTTVRLRAEHPEHRAWTVEATAGDLGIDIALDAAARLEGRVVDPDGAAVAGAMVLVSKEERAEDPETMGAAFTPRRPVAQARSDDEGKFVVRGVSAGRLRLDVAASGFLAAVHRVEVVEGERITDLELELRVGAVLEGRITTEDGRAVADARVEVLVDGFDLAGRLAPPLARSDEDGFYHLAGLELGRRVVRARHADHVAVERAVELRPGDGNGLDLVLPTGVEVSGRAIDGAGEAVAGARLSLFSPEGRLVADPARTGVDGRFRFRAAPAGRWRVEGERPGYATAVVRGLEVAPGAPVDGVEIRFARGGAVVGRLLGLDFDQVSGAEVWANSPSGPNRRGRVLFDGRFRIEGLSPGEWTVAARAPGETREAAAAVTIESGAAETPVDLEFVDGGFALAGHVLADGRPLAGALVSGALVAGGPGSGAVTDAAGRFLLPDLAAGTYRLTVLHPATRRTLHEVVEIEGDRTLRFELPPTDSATLTDTTPGTPTEDSP